MSLAKRVSKKGLSDVVTTVLIILMTVAAIGLIWAFVIPMVRDNLANATVDKQIDLTIKTAGGESCVDYNKGILVVNVFKGEEDYEVSKLKFIVISEGSSISFVENNGLKKQTGKDFYLNISGLSSIEKVGVAPYVVDGKKEKLYAAIYANIEDKKCASNAINVTKIENQILNESSGSEGGSGNEGGSCISDDSCAENTPIGETCKDSCGNEYGGTMSGVFTTGAGTTTDPYQISNCLQLQNMSHSLSSSYELVKDIDCSDTSTWNEGAGWEPVGFDYGNRFSGKLNGQGFTISDLYINRPDGEFIGLFGYTDYGYNGEIEIKNLVIKKSVIIGDDYVGGVVGRLGVGSSFYNNSFEGVVTGNDYVGGIIGSFNEDHLTMFASYISANANVTGNNYVGGLIGTLGYSSYYPSNLSNSYFRGWVEGNEYVGGLVGMASSSITNSYSTGSVEGTEKVGGLVGYSYSSSITNSYSTGSVKGEGFVGGLFGFSGNLEINNCAWLTSSHWWFIESYESCNHNSCPGESFCDHEWVCENYGGGDWTTVSHLDSLANLGFGTDSSLVSEFYSKNHPVYKDWRESDWVWSGNSLPTLSGQIN